MFNKSNVKVVAKHWLRKVINGWILVANHSVKDNKQFLNYASTIIQYLDHIELSQFLKTLHNYASITNA